LHECAIVAAHRYLELLDERDLHLVLCLRPNLTANILLIFAYAGNKERSRRSSGDGNDLFSHIAESRMLRLGTVLKYAAVVLFLVAIVLITYLVQIGVLPAEAK
jgi:hypothetical protein